MYTNTTTLRAMLTLLKPEVSCNPGTWKGSSIQKSKQHIRQAWPQVTKPNLKPWSSFDANTLNALNMKDYGYILDLEIHLDTSPDRLRLRTGRAIGGMKLTSPAHIFNLIKWNDKVLQQTLGFAKTYLKRHTGANLRYRVGDSETSDIRRQTGIPLDIDHIVKLEASQRITPWLLASPGRAPPSILPYSFMVKGSRRAPILRGLKRRACFSSDN